MSYNRQNRFQPGPPPRDRHYQHDLAPPNGPVDTRTFSQRLASEGRGICRLSDIEELRQLRALQNANEEAEELRLFNLRIEAAIEAAISRGALDQTIERKVNELARLSRTGGQVAIISADSAESQASQAKLTITPAEGASDVSRLQICVLPIEEAPAI
jgi:hypothetical protein